MALRVPCLLLALANAMVEYVNVQYLGGSETVDINNSHVQAYRQFLGMYPASAGITATHGPFKSVPDVYEFPGMLDAFKNIIKTCEGQLVCLPANQGFIEETVERFNNVRIRCLNIQMVLISQASQDPSDFFAQASDAKADMSRAVTNIDVPRVTHENIEEELEEHNRICFERISNCKDEITVMEADAVIMAGTVNMTTRDGEGSFAQCASESGAQVRFAASSVQQVSQIKPNRTYHRLQAAMFSSTGWATTAR